jgi:aldose 1-epimerase
MTFQVRHEKRPNKFNVDDTVCVLDDGQGSFLEIAPALGFNAYRWHVPDGELSYADPKFFEENKPTRSGVPVLFPFPNRIRDGRFTWEGKEYQLPTNDPSGKNAIHGFVCHKPWRVIAEGTDTDAAWVTAEFVASRDAPETLPLWPADYRIALTYRFQGHTLDILAEIANPGARDLPWGLGYHPYFDLSLFGGAAANVTVRAEQIWELIDCLPTGQQLPVNSSHDLRGGKRHESLKLDDVYTRLTGSDAMRSVGLLRDGKRRLELHASDNFREIVAFTPPHRRAICLEPYTCVTDAINLQQQGIDAGWRVLNPGRSEQARVKLAYRTS